MYITLGKKYDILIIIIISTIGGFAAYQGQQMINPIIVDTKAFDVWFDADIPRVFLNMVERTSNHYRTKVHPIFSLIAFPPVFLLRMGLNIEAITAVRIVIAAIAALWTGTIFLLLRLINCRLLDATLFSLMAGTSAAAMFWFVVPETYSFGSLTILLGLCFVAFAQHRKLSSLWYVVISGLTLSITTTNWMTGLLATFINHTKKQALQITINAFCLVVLLWSVQKAIFPSAVFFLGDTSEKRYVLMESSGGPLQVLKSFIFHTMVMPTINANIVEYTPPYLPDMRTQFSTPGSGSVWGMIAVVLWIALLGLGIWGFFSVRHNIKLRLVLGLTLLGHLALHSLYGSETFLYSLHFAPLLVTLAAFSTFTPARVVALILAGSLIVTAGVNNTIQFNKALLFVDSQASWKNQDGIRFSATAVTKFASVLSPVKQDHEWIPKKLIRVGR